MIKGNLKRTPRGNHSPSPPKRGEGWGGDSGLKRIGLLPLPLSSLGGGEGEEKDGY